MSTDEGDEIEPTPIPAELETPPVSPDPWLQLDADSGDLPAIRRVSPLSLVPRLVAEFGYSLALMPWSTKSEAQSVAEQLAWGKPVVREAFLTWWLTGEVVDLTVRGTNLRELMAVEEAYRPVRAFLRLGRIARDQPEDDAAVGLRAEDFSNFADEFRASIGRLDDQVFLVRHVSAFPEMTYEVYNPDGPEGPALHIDEVTPGLPAWGAFWEVMDALDIWHWAPRTVAPVLNPEGAMCWSIALQRGGQSVKLSGHDAYPDHELFQHFCDAVRVLLGDRYFPRPG